MNQSYYISRNYKGIHVNAIKGNLLPKDVYETFSYAVGMYGIVVHMNEQLTGNEWIERITQTYSMSDRLDRVLGCIRIAMDCKLN